MSLLEIKDKVQRYLIDMGLHGIELTNSGNGYTFRMESTRVFVECIEYGSGDEGFTVVRVTAPIVNDLKGTPELFEYVATHADDWIFGHLGLMQRDDGAYTLIFGHRILADYLDPAELERAVGAVAVTGNNIDDDLATRFGGTVFHED